MNEQEAVTALVRALGPVLAVAVLLFASVLVLGARVLGAYAQRRAEAAADAQVGRRVREHGLELDRQLEEHKARLALSADAERLTFQRQLQEFGLFAAKRHAVYAKLFARILTAQGRLGGVYGLRRMPDYARYERAELEAEMRGRPGGSRVGEGVAAQVLAQFDAGDRRGAVRTLEEAMRAVEREDAYGAWQRAKTYYLLNELYLSAAVVHAVDAAFEAMHHLSVHILHPDPSTADARLQATEAMNAGVERVRATMRADLQRSDYAIPVGAAAPAEHTSVDPPPGAGVDAPASPTPALAGGDAGATSNPDVSRAGPFP